MKELFDANEKVWFFVGTTEESRVRFVQTVNKTFGSCRLTPENCGTFMSVDRTGNCLYVSIWLWNAGLKQGEINGKRVAAVDFIKYVSKAGNYWLTK